MSRDSDWHVFDKAVDVTASAVKGAAAGLQPTQVGEIFREIHAALREAADVMESSDRKTGF
jgi:hypothetical protein